MAYIRLPDNSYFKVPEDSTPEAAMQLAQQKYPKAFLTEKQLEEKQGFGAATSEAFRGAKAAAYEGAGKLFGIEGLKQASEEEYRKLREEPGFIPTTEEDRTAAFKKGLLPGIAAVGREFISEPVGGIVGRYGAPIGLGALATAAAPATGVGALGAGVIGGGVTALADYLPQVGENLQRQRDVGKTEDLSDAALGAIPQAALSGLNLRLGMLPKGVQNIFKADAAALQKQVLSGALKPEAAISQLSGNLRNILLSTGSAATVGAGTMIGEEAIRRAQAGQSLTDEEALGDYATMAKDAALLAPLFGVPRGALKRRGEVKGIEEAGIKRAEKEGLELRAKQDAEAALKADEDFRVRQAETGDLFAETYRTEGPAKGKEAFGKMEGDVSPLPGAADNLTVAERERQAQARGAETQTPFEAERQRKLLEQRVGEFETRIAEAASKGDVNTITQLNAQLVQSRNALKEAEALVKQVGPVEKSPAQQFEALTEEFQKRTKELQKAGDLGDFDKINKLTPKLQELQTKLDELQKTGPDLFAVEEASKAREEAARLRSKAETQAALEQGQQDLFAQVGGAPSRAEARQAQVLDRYQDNLRQLEEAYAANADKRIIDQLVEKVRESAAEKASRYAKTADTKSVQQIEAGQQRIERITRAIAEAEAKGDTASVAGLRNQLAKAVVDTAERPLDSRRSKALEDQQTAIEGIRTAVEDLKSGRFLGEGARDTATAASMRSGLERQANETVGRYVEAALREINAVREQKGLRRLTNEEVIRAAMDVRGHLENAIRNLNEPALRMPKEGTVSAIERQLAQIKAKHHKGPAIEKKRGPEGLKVEVDTLRRRLQTGEKIDGGKPFETEARRKERLAEEAAEAERVARSGVNPDQRNLFGDKDLEPVATYRATPENFQRMLQSRDVKRAQAREAKEEAIAKTKAAAEAKKTEAQKKRDEVIAERRKTVEAERAAKEKLQTEQAKAESRERIEGTQVTTETSSLSAKKLAGILADLRRQLKAEKTSERPDARRVDSLKRSIEDNKRRYKETKEYEDTKRALNRERAKEERDEALISRLAYKVADLEENRKESTITTRTYKKVGSESPEARAERLAQEQREAAETLKARNPVARAKAQQAKMRAQESELNKQLKALRKEKAALFKSKEALDTSIAKAKTEKARAFFQKNLDEVKQKIDDRDFEKRERVLTKQLEELSQIGGKVERVLEVAGNKPARVQKAPRLRVGKTAAQQEQLKALFKEVAAEGKLDFTDTFGGDDVAQFRGRSGTDYRAEAPNTGAKLDPAVSKRVAEAIEKNAPKDVKLRSVESYADLPDNVKKQLVRDGITEGSPQSQSVRGFVTPDGEVYVIRGNHESVKDMERTYAHELIGHAGVDRVLGPEGMQALVKRMNAQGGALELARKLGVEDQVRGALDDYALGIANMTKNKASKAEIDKAIKDMETQAVRELLAYTAEKRVDETFKQKAGRWVQEVIGAVRAAFRKMGLAELSNVTTSDIFNILRQSQRNYNKGQLGAFRDVNGQMSFRSQAIFNPSIDPNEAGTVSKVIARDKPFKDKIKGNTLGMSMMHRFVDRFAGLEYIARNMRDKLEGVQMMYYNRLYDQRNNMIAEIATHGSVGLVRNQDGSFQYKSRKGPSLKSVFESVNKAKSEFGNAQATLDYFGTYLAMERAASNKGGLKAGLEKLDLSGKISEAEANAILKRGRANANFQEGRKAYREYNNGMIDLMVESGRLSKERAVELKKGDYVPYYRDRGGEIIDTENNIRVGDIKTQAYLKELIGGDSAIVNFETGALQNTYMLTDMAMSNIAAKNTAFTLSKLGMAEIKNGSGPAKANIIRFYENGVEKHAEINTRGNYMEMEAKLDKMRDAGKANTPEYKKLRERAEASRASESAFGDIPAELIVKGMEGVASAMPAGVSMMRGPANLLRKAVTRNPAYAMRIALKDSLSGWITSGADVKPFVSIMGGLKKSWQGDAPEVRALQSQGVIGGHAFAGTMSDMRTIAQQIAQGQSGWEKLWAKADRMAIMADEAQRVSLYNGFIAKGMSEIEASLATLESANFTKHGYSPTVKALSTMIPFFNAQIQGLNVFARALSGKSLFEDKLGLRENMLKRGMMLAGATMAYSALMQNNEAYKNATDTDKLNYWFVPLPFMDEPVRVPIPFEAGSVFKAIPEAVYNLMATDAKSKDVLPAVGRLALNSIPGMTNLFLPQGIKPIVELTTGTSFFTMESIESARQKSELPGFRAGTNTTEFSKALGGALNVSPIQIDHAVNAYTSGLGIALLSMFNPLLRDASAPDRKASQMAIFGGFFQPTDGVGLINKAYEDIEKIEQVNRTYKNLEDTDPEKADKFLDKYLDTLDKASAAGKFKKEMGDLNKEERMIRADTNLSAAQKRAELDEIRQIKIEMAKEFMSISRE